MSKISLTAVFTFLLGTGLASAQQAPAMHEGHLNQLDTDKSGGVTQGEYQTFMTGAFTKIDADNDGYVSQDDFKNVLTAEQFSSTDANKDGRVSQNEFMTQVMKDFASADRTGDGQLK